MKCQKCQNEAFLPFRCQYCGGYFCSEHRLPENHECPQIELARMPKKETEPVTIQKQRQHEYTVTYAVPEPKRRRIHFSSKEIWHLTIAALLVAGVGLSFGLFPSLFYIHYVIDYFVLVLFSMLLTASFFIHELAHKIVAQEFGFWAEFRLTLVGAILTLISVFLPPQSFKVISPGAVIVAGSADRESMGKISISGPTTNIMLSLVFFAIASLSPEYALIFMLSAAFNAWIALFNLLPLGLLDGAKIFNWNKKIWASAFAVSLALTVISYALIW